MADNIYSYDFTNGIRDVSQVFDILLQKKPVWYKYIPIGAAPKAHKHEWINQRLTPKSSAITVIATGSATSITVGDASAFKAGDIVRATTSTGAYIEEQVLVTAVNTSTNVLTVTREYGSTTATDYEVGYILYPMSSLAENTTGTASDNVEGTADYNYTQIFDSTFTLSRTAAQSQYYDMANEATRLVYQHMNNVMWEVNQATLFGKRKARSATTAGLTGTMGGLMSSDFLGNTTSGNVKNAATAALSMDMFNDIWEYIFADGGMGGNFMVLCAENQARKISDLNTSGTNPVVYIPDGTRKAGQLITELQAGFQPDDGSFTGRVFIEPMMPKDRILIVNLNDIEKNVMQAPSLVDATNPGQDGKTWRILTELTMTIRNPLYSHGMIYGLAV